MMRTAAEYVFLPSHGEISPDTSFLSGNIVYKISAVRFYAVSCIISGVVSYCNMISSDM